MYALVKTFCVYANKCIVLVQIHVISRFCQNSANCNTYVQNSGFWTCWAIGGDN